MNSSFVVNEINRFTQFKEKLANSVHFSVNSPVEYSYVITPRKSTPHSEYFTKKIPLLIKAITHGNEVAGLSVLNGILELIEKNVLTPKFPIAFLLGNVEAAKKGKRFIEKDLNRCYQHPNKKLQSNTIEDRRSQLTEKLMLDCFYMVDLHQTQAKTTRPFFVLNHHPLPYSFARRVNDRITILSFLRDPLDESLSTSTAFMLRNGGVGITLELGTRGSDLYQESFGIIQVLNALKCIENELLSKEESLGPRENTLTPFAPIHCNKDYKLNENISNFFKIKKNDPIGYETESKKPILSPEDGRILFPKFKQGPYATLKAPEDPLCWLIREVDYQEILAANLKYKTTT